MASVAVVEKSQIEKPSDLDKKGDSKKEAQYKRWVSEIDKAEKHYEKYNKRVDKIIKIYRAESDSKSNGRKYNALWSLTSTLQPNLFSKLPKPYIERRYRDNDPIARMASRILERALSYVVDCDDMFDATSAAVDDYILAARGTIWNRYSPEFDLRTSEKKNYIANDNTEIPDEAEIGEDEKGKFYQEKYEALTNEELETDHIQVKSFIVPAASNWKQIPWVAKKVLMTRTELETRFGKKVGGKIPLYFKSDGSRYNKDSDPQEMDGLFLMAEVYEVWVKESRKVVWICRDHPEIIDEIKDPLELRNFWPTPKPLFDTLTNNSLIPVPGFKYYEDIAQELDDVTYRISLLVDTIRVVGVYDQSLGDIIQRITSQTEDNDMIPVKNWQAFMDGGGLKGAMQFLPIEQIIVVLEKLYKARSELVRELYEITGISDIIRGSTNANETATAQKIKGNYAGKRLKRMQDKVERFVREDLEIKAEIICKHYSEETIMRISNAEEICVGPDGQFSPEMFQQAVGLLKDNLLRHFRIKIDTRNLADEEISADREQGTMFIQSLTGLMSQVMPVAQTMPQLAKVVKEVIMFGVRMYPVARSVEASLEQALDELSKNVPPPEQKSAGKAGPSPEELELKRDELRIRREELGLERSKFALDSWLKKKDVALREMQLANDNEAKKLNERRQAAAKKGDLEAKHLEIEQKDRHKQIDVELEREQAQIEAAQAEADRQDEARRAAEDRAHEAQQADVDREREDKRDVAKHTLEVEKAGVSAAEARMKREDNRSQHKDKMKAQSESAKLKQKDSK